MEVCGELEEASGAFNGLREQVLSIHCPQAGKQRATSKENYPDVARVHKKLQMTQICACWSFSNTLP
jgi:hypothetical protein